jgi:uncharacterized integral membrane protein (TIGR00697 family)
VTQNAPSSPQLKSGGVILTSIFIASLVSATLLASKLTSYGGFTFSIGLFFFPLTFIANEMGAEVYGRAFSKNLILSGIFAQLLVLLSVVIGDQMPASDFHDVSGSYHEMFALAPRMISASICAYLFAQFIDLESFLKLKRVTQGKYLWLRSLVAILISQAVDTFIFTAIFLGGVLPMHELIKTGILGYAIKVVVGFLDTPLLYLGVYFLKKLDGTSVADSSHSLWVRSIRTPVFHPGQNLVEFVMKAIPANLVQENMVLAITSKIISLAENQILKRDQTPKRTIIEREADQFLAETIHGVFLTVKHGILIPSAGIDESNSETGDYILFPKDPYASADRLKKALQEKWKLKNLGIVVTDSHTQPLRKGVIGIALSHAGFKATHNLVGEKDLFGREMKMTHVNAIDSIATAAVYKMGEIAERCPLALVYTEGLEFTNNVSSVDAQKEIQIPMSEDLYGVLFPSSGETK